MAPCDGPRSSLCPIKALTSPDNGCVVAHLSHHPYSCFCSHPHPHTHPRPITNHQGLDLTACGSASAISVLTLLPLPSLSDLASLQLKPLVSGPLYPKLSTCFEGARLTQLVQLVTASRLFPCHEGQVDP